MGVFISGGTEIRYWGYST